MTVTEVPQNPSGAQQFSLSTDKLVDLQNSISDLDKRLAAKTGGEDAKREVAKNTLLDKYETETDQRMDNLLPQIEKSVPNRDEFIALLAAIQESFIQGEFREALNKYLDQVVAEQPAEDETSEETLKDERKKKVDLFKSVKQILESFGVDVSGFKDPTRSPRGSSSSTTKTGFNKEQYRFLINGTPATKANNVISAIIYQNTEGMEMKDGEPVMYEGAGDKTKVRIGTKQFKDWLAVKLGATWGAKDEWEITLPDGKKIGARRFTEQDKNELGLNEPEEADSDSENPEVVSENGSSTPETVSTEGTVTA